MTTSLEGTKSKGSSKMLKRDGGEQGKEKTFKDEQQQPQQQIGMADKECVNFMSKFRDKDTRALKNLNSAQFIEVWNNYDKDGE